MYQLGHTVKDAPKLPLNLLDALRNFDKDTSSRRRSATSSPPPISSSSTQEWNSYVSHFTQWERDNTLSTSEPEFGKRAKKSRKEP